MHSIVTTLRGTDIKVEVANFCAAMDTLIDQDVVKADHNPYTACCMKGYQLTDRKPGLTSLL